MLQPWHYRIWELKSYIDITPIYKPCVLGRQVQFWNICLSYAFHFQSVPNICLNDWWSHMVPRIKHFIVRRLRAFQQLYYRSLKIKMIQLLRGYVPQWTFYFIFSPSLSTFFAVKCVISLFSWSHGDTDCRAFWWGRTASYFQIQDSTPVSILRCWTHDFFPGVYGISWGRGGRAFSCHRLFHQQN